MKNLSLIIFFFVITESNLFAQDGSLDSTFGTNGMVTLDINSGSSDYSTDIVVQADEKILVFGTAADNFIVTRHNINGDPDSTFGINGIATIDIGGSETPVKFGLQSDEKIIIMGTAYIGSDLNLVLARLKTDGSIDSTFGTNGVVTSTFGYESYGFNDLQIQQDNKIVVSGTVANYSTPELYNVIVLRYTENGNPDNSFGTNGSATIDFNSNYNEKGYVALQSNGKLIVLTNTYNSGIVKAALARLNSNGILDNSFGTNGKIILNSISGNDYWNCIVTQSDDKIIIGGKSNDGNNNVFALMRLTQAGMLDNTFSGTGIVTTSFANNNASGNDCTIQTDGKILLAGYLEDINFNYSFAIARFDTSGNLDTTFDSDGKQSFSFNPSPPTSDQCKAVTMQNDGKILMTGGVGDFSTGDFGIARLIGSTTNSSVVVSIKIFLEGPYNSPNMNASLTIPTTSPYQEDPETVSSIPNISGNEVVDWVLVQLRDQNNETNILESQSAFLLQDGTVVDVDGSNPVQFSQPGNTSYYIAVKHRNHLAVMSANPVQLTAN